VIGSHVKGLRQADVVQPSGSQGHRDRGRRAGAVR
jgi:hypothetical protein